MKHFLQSFGPLITSTFQKRHLNISISIIETLLSTRVDEIGLASILSHIGPEARCNYTPSVIRKNVLRCNTAFKYMYHRRAIGAIVFSCFAAFFNGSPTSALMPDVFVLQSFVMAAGTSVYPNENRCSRESQSRKS